MLLKKTDLELLQQEYWTRNIGYCSQSNIAYKTLYWTQEYYPQAILEIGHNYYYTSFLYSVFFGYKFIGQSFNGLDQYLLY